MSPYDNAGRIHKQAFLVSNLTLFAVCMMSACARYYIRIKIQKEFSIDDGILLFGLCCLIVAIILLFKLVDEMYIVGTSEAGNLVGVSLPDDFVEQAYDFQKMVTVALVLTWCAIVSVKFSYLFLFKRLVGRMARMNTYWWFAAIYNVITSVYGAVVYGVACPEYYSIKALQCAFGKGLRRSIAYSQSQMVLDIVGDLLIIFIPCCLIWSVKIRWSQKLALASTLCLTILTIFNTIIRIAGIHTGRTIKSIDSVWETYWQFVAASVALTMTAATAFRTFFVSRTRDDRGIPHLPLENVSQGRWYTKGGRLLRSIFSARLWHSWRAKTLSRSSDDSSRRWHGSSIKLRHQIPGGTLTGLDSLIDRQGRSEQLRSSKIMQKDEQVEFRDSWPLAAVGKTP